MDLMRDPLRNRGLATSLEERGALGLRGLLPAGVRSFEVQETCAMAQLRSKSTPLEKYSFLQGVQNVDERLYYSLLTKHTKECMPLVYTPTVGAACLAWSDLYAAAPRGLYLSLEDKGRIRGILEAWPGRDKVKAIVFTDGERILGLGDLGANGMGIPVGKLALYTACAGVAPEACLPVSIDAGTNNEALRADPAYVGLRRPRERGPAYDELVEEFVVAAQAAFGPDVLLQFEDFGNANAFRLLERYQPRACTFNDDIQGTASVVLAGLIASGRLSGRALAEETFLFLGAGEAGVGIADLIALAVSKESGCSLAEARAHIWLVDSKGLVTADCAKLAHHKRPYAHAAPAGMGPPAPKERGGVLLTAVEALKPTCLIGVSAVPNTFTKEVVEAVVRHTAHCPVVMALSNPTSQAECTAEQAYTWSGGRCLFASGSPFDAVTLPDGRSFTPGQVWTPRAHPGRGAALPTPPPFKCAAALLECPAKNN